MLINASNLHVGGGIQVAVSFLYELSKAKELEANVTVWCSTEVHRNLERLDCDFKKFPAYEVVNTYGIELIWSSAARRIRRFDVVFTIFGPLYILRKPRVSIVGFAQAWIISGQSDLYSGYSIFRRLKEVAKFKLQAFFFREADKLVVELDHVRSGLVSERIAKRDSVVVVRNCLASFYFDPRRWEPVAIPRVDSDVRLGFVGRNYSHKNVSVFPEIRRRIRELFGLDVSFYVTFTEDEWGDCSADFRENVVNVGPLTVAQCPSFYQEMDGVVFPSLLECFSATPLEAMVMKRPLFASDRPFNRDVCGSFAHYFDPHDPVCAATIIGKYFIGAESDDARLSAARAHAVNFSSARERAESYLELMLSLSTNDKNFG